MFLLDHFWKYSIGSIICSLPRRQTAYHKPQFIYKLPLLPPVGMQGYPVTCSEKPFEKHEGIVYEMAKSNFLRADYPSRPTHD
jgi:hypothetical protein